MSFWPRSKLGANSAGKKHKEVSSSFPSRAANAERQVGSFMLISVPKKEALDRTALSSFFFLPSSSSPCFSPARRTDKTFWQVHQQQPLKGMFLHRAPSSACSRKNNRLTTEWIKISFQCLWHANECRDLRMNQCDSREFYAPVRGTIAFIRLIDDRKTMRIFQDERRFSWKCGILLNKWRKNAISFKRVIR